MESLKKYSNLKASSILESVIALSIISVCLYIALMVFSAVFAPRSASKFYNTKNKVNELFYLAQLKSDSLDFENQEDNMLIEEEEVNPGLKKVNIQFTDSLKIEYRKSFYILND